MIVRLWSGRASAQQPGAYPAHVRRAVLPELRRLPGFCGAEWLAREADGQVDYQVLTRWESLDAIRGFAGADLERAVVEPEAVAALVALEARARHVTVIEDARP